MIHRMDPPEDPDREPMPERIDADARHAAARCRADDGRWAYEIKWDGVRAIGYVEGGRLRLRRATATTSRRATPSCASSAERWRSHEAIVDGEVVAFDATGGRASSGCSAACT